MKVKDLRTLNEAGNDALKYASGVQNIGATAKGVVDDAKNAITNKVNSIKDKAKQTFTKAKQGYSNNAEALFNRAQQKRDVKGMGDAVAYGFNKVYKNIGDKLESGLGPRQMVILIQGLKWENLTANNPFVKSIIELDGKSSIYTTDRIQQLYNLYIDGKLTGREQAPELLKMMVNHSAANAETKRTDRAQADIMNKLKTLPEKERIAVVNNLVSTYYGNKNK